MSLDVRELFVYLLNSVPFVRALHSLLNPFHARAPFPGHLSRGTFPGAPLYTASKLCWGGGGGG